MPRIVLSTLNARYAHASLGLRCLRANLGVWRAESAIQEFVIGQKTEEIAERILALQPRILGLGIYIWNVEESTRLVALLKVLDPDLTIVLGGPEVSHEQEQQAICAQADYVITGWGDVSFAHLAEQILSERRPESRLIRGVQPPLTELALPYDEYTDEDIGQRQLYVEASRGCPFKCAFCLSALDATAWPFPVEPFLQALERLYRRGARQFKFVDRTFNLKVDASLRILDFFLEKMGAAPDDPVFAHFELIPDHLPDRLKQAIQRFPAGTLQFEIGIQTWDPDTQKRISRRQKNDVAQDNLVWLRSHTQAHLHVDLIAGLPGETLEQLASGFDRLVGLRPHEIQFGILKRLRGAPIIAQTHAHQLRFNPNPPYNILASDCLDFGTLQRLSRFARYWDIVANSGRHARSLQLLLGNRPFEGFLRFSDWLYARTRQTHALAHERLVHLLHEYLCAQAGNDPAAVANALIADYRGTGGRSRLRFEPGDDALPTPRTAPRTATPKRQQRHATTQP